MASNDISFIVFIPLILCLVAIAFLLSVFYSQRQQQRGRVTWIHLKLANHCTCYAIDILTLAQHQQNLSDDELDELYEATPDNDDGLDDENDNAGEGSSSAATLRIRKVGKKKGEKLRRKEQLRQYREVREKRKKKVPDSLNDHSQLVHGPST
jgi:hypothetical protein